MSKRAGRRDGVAQRDSDLVPFKFLITNSLVGGAATVLVSPNGTFSPRLLAQADTWALYRFRQLSFRLRRPPVAVTAIQAAAYIAGVTDTVPATTASASEVMNSVEMSMLETVIPPWHHVPRGDLVGYQPWYKTIVGTPDAASEILGSIFLTGNGTDAFLLEVKGVVEFRDAVPTAATPMALSLRQSLHEERAEKHRLAERDRLLRLLAPAPGVGEPRTRPLAP